MATGTQTYMGLALPRYGESTMKQVTGADDILTLEGGNGQTGDFFVARTSTGTERFVVEDGGNIDIDQSAAGDIGVKIVQASTPTAAAIEMRSNDDSTVRWSVTRNHGV